MAKREFAILGAPYGGGAGVSGCALTPKLFRERGLAKLIKMRMKNWASRKEFSIEDFGDISCKLLMVRGKANKAKVFCTALEKKMDILYANNKIPIVIGGDHTIGVASLAASANHLEKKFGRKKLGVIWVDAHADINAYEVGNIHGKSLAIALGEVFSGVFTSRGRYYFT
ncbi:MAG: arginase family protein [Fusobacteria bacterium]|nr:arginase family protein [Fusobacteriota bacterium]